MDSIELPRKLTPAQFKRLLKKIKNYYTRIFITTHTASNRNTRELTNIRDSNFISFKNTPIFLKYINRLTEDQIIQLNEEILNAENKLRSNFRMTSMVEQTRRRTIEEMPHNRDIISNSNNGNNNSPDGGRKIKKTR